MNKPIVSIAIVALAYATPVEGGSFSALVDFGTLGDAQTSFIYDPFSGKISIDAPFDSNLTSINITSDAGIFTGADAENLGGSFDIDSDTMIFKATFGSSFGSISFGNIAQSGLSKEFILHDITVTGSLEGGGDLGAVDFCNVCSIIPEPSTGGYMLITLALCLFVSRYRLESASLNVPKESSSNAKAESCWRRFAGIPSAAFVWSATGRRC